jgi:hypothetical protein
MLATMLVHIPLAIAPLLQPPSPPVCQIDVLTPMAIEERALGEFNVSVQEYVMLHRRLARTLPPSEMFDDEDPFFADELRRVLVAARPGATSGLFFTSRVAEVLRQRIELALASTGGSAIPYRDDLLREAGRATVNEPLLIPSDPFRWSTLIGALPDIPLELAYVVSGRDLVLVDVSANLVIDVLTDAIPAWPGSDVIYR